MMMMMMVRTGWILVILLHCMPSHASQSPTTKEQRLQIHCTPAKSHKPEFVPCPNAEDALFKLFMGQKEVYNHSCNHVEKLQQCSSLNRSSDVHLCKNEDNSVGFSINGETLISEVIYMCEATVRYPPPFITVQSDKVIFLKGDLCPSNNTNGNTESSKEETEGNRRFQWIWIVVVALLSTYSLAITITASVFWVKLRWTDSQNDYMNAKPITIRKHRKKKWAQNPIPRYF